MGLEPLRSFLRPRRTIALDTSVLIYQLDKNARYFSLSDFVFAWLERPGNSAITSTLSMTELLVPAYREGDEHRLKAYKGLLSTYPGLSWIPPDHGIAGIAARLRASYGLKTPDAIQAATAVNTQTRGFVTNDPVYRRVTELDTVVLDDLL